ncbi:MAG: hypothetical protein O2944_01360 [Proteobacteria bacterium]|nr:hypothetical protein [Pseudomonadota bacterium]
MTPLADIELEISAAAAMDDAKTGAERLLGLGEDVVCHWIAAHGETPTTDSREGFRLLALHRQGAKGVPSFNACRETCRELAYHLNLISAKPDHPEVASRLQMMGLIATHLYLFIAGKLEESELGDFCCSSRPLHAAE